MQKTLTIIDLSAIRSNAELVKKMLGGKKFFAVVKADAYGHGAEQVARELDDLADGFCVAIVDEGIALRVSGITKPVLVFAPPLSPEDVVRARYYNLTLTVNSVETAKMIGALPCHIKINTGMNRYGVNSKDLQSVLNVLEPKQITGVYTHMYAADNGDIADVQLSEFLSAAGKVKGKNGGAVAHISASGGILRGGKYLLDGARCGIMLYGYPPEGFECDGLKRAMKVYAPIAQVTKVFGGGVGYNVAQRAYKKLITCRLGYADGFSRNVSLGEKTLCMDAFMLDGEREREIISFDGQKYIRALDDAALYAERAGTISYEVLCAVTKRSIKIYER
jgi:alanine racemase